jgi:hypothetical protein
VKTLIATLLFVSSTTFAVTLDATEALLSILPAGNYNGVTPEESPCEISVRNLSNRIAVVASKTELSQRSEVFLGATYLWRPGKREFLSSTLTTSLTDKRENFVRTIAVQENTQYVVVGNIITSNTGVSESVVECIVNL